MKDKKTLAILCSSAFVMALALSGCFGASKNNKESSTDADNTSAEPASSEGSESTPSSSESTKTWTVTFNSQGGSAVASQKVKNGGTVTKPADPTKANFSFTGWYEEAAAVTPFDFATKITTNWTLYAGWQSGGGDSSSSDSGSSDSSTTSSGSDTTEQCDFYVNIGGTEYELVKQQYALQENQVAEYRVDVPAVSAGQEIRILDADKNALSENFGAEPGDNNVDETAGVFTIHNNAEPAFVIVKTWETGWTNFYVSGYQAEQVEDVYYAVINDTSYKLEKQTYDLAAEQVAEYRANVGSVLAGQTIVIQDKDHVALSENFGAEPGNNNVNGVAGVYTIHNDAEDAFVIVKTWESGWTNFYVSGYVAPEPQETTYTVENLPNWITNDGCVIYAWVWGSFTGGEWAETTYTDETTLTFKVDGELDGFLLARCVSGTTQPDWNLKSGNDAGRIYNKTGDVNCISGTYVYQSPEWVGYPG